MSHRLRQTLKAGALILLSGAWIAPASAQGDAKRGEYLAKAGGCLGCHTEDKQDAVPYTGGRALKTPFGTFYGPNITPHQQAGIGRWTEADFMRAMAGGKDVPNLTPTGLKQWSDGELMDLLLTGETPDDGPVAEAMDEVVRNTTSQLTPQDLAALIVYLRSLPPLPD
ncbi:MAG TPA: c-type cytochrome [Sulfuricaulis sp.]|nr:c-type cytochrome [Sulfuricaulis sp.]